MSVLWLGYKKVFLITSPFVSVWSPTTVLERALSCLTALIGREVALPGWYERNRQKVVGYWKFNDQHCSIGYAHTILANVFFIKLEIGNLKPRSLLIKRTEL